uniref:Steroid 5-alpha reductase C-terminal domain-containing protein n=1 Tax=Spumella elongata TaxID=89044 RepID=A0A7S3GPN9_9STRA|mmetsp:Transcript_13060/g.22951  ORF Transcript_13060/g.22951 Transcript_13060/m.22951 type:complete len:320 (+) Transcript_13060:68-1027(+)
MSLALSNLARVGAIVGGCNAVGYGLTAAFETHKLTDLVGAGSFVAATLAMSYKNGLLNLKAGGVMHPKLLLVNVGVILWGSRLASFLFSRVLKVGEDKRLQKFFRKPGEAYLDIKASFFPVRLATFWTIQAAWAFICLLPVTLYNSVPLMLSNGGPNPQFLLKSAHGPVATLLTVLPVAGIFLGVGIEALADWQKNTFRENKKNDGHWCDVGLWRMSRYPNYFGELLTWWSVYFSCLPALLSATAGASGAAGTMFTAAPAVALLSPVFITFLLFKLSGIPLLEKKHSAEYKGNKQYEEYVRITPLLIPNPFVASVKKSS